MGSKEHNAKIAEAEKKLKEIEKCRTPYSGNIDIPAIIGIGNDKEFEVTGAIRAHSNEEEVLVIKADKNVKDIKDGPVK